MRPVSLFAPILLSAQGVTYYALKCDSSRTINASTIQNLEAKVQYYVQETSRLKRLRNSLNPSVCMPPEILGHIFWWCVSSGVSPRGRIARNTFNFLLVCRYWFDVATSTPSLWTFWGTSLRECVAFHRYSGAVPLYLNLVDATTNRDIREASGVLQDLSVQRRIRHLHVHTPPKILANILSPMSTPQPSPIRSQIRSLMLTVEGSWIPERPEEVPDITDFLNTHSFPELQTLRLRGCNLQWECLILQTSKLTHLFIHAYEKSRKPTVLQIAALFARNSALEEINLSLEIAPTPEDILPESSSISLPRLRRLAIYGNVAGCAQLLNLLTFSNELEHVKIDLFLDGTAMDVAAALTPFLPNLFHKRQPSNLAIHIVYALVGLSINVSRPGKRGDAEDFLMLRISSLDMGFWDVVPTLPEEVAKRLPTANVTGLSIRRYSGMFRQDFSHLFQTVGAVQELRVTDSAINDIIQVLASPSPTVEGSEAILLPRLHTLRLKDINFASTPHAGAVVHLSHLLEQRYRDGIPLNKLSMAYCPNFCCKAYPEFTGYLNDHFCWDRYEAVGDRLRVCRTCHTRWGDLD